MELRGDFASGALHPGDLKPSVTKAIDRLLESVRDRCKRKEAAKTAEAVVKAYLKKAVSSSSKRKT
jgi:tyrosyl-tRNA synthetase